MDNAGMDCLALNRATRCLAQSLVCLGLLLTTAASAQQYAAPPTQSAASTAAGQPNAPSSLFPPSTYTPTPASPVEQVGYDQNAFPGRNVLREGQNAAATRPGQPAPQRLPATEEYRTAAREIERPAGRYAAEPSPRAPAQGIQSTTPPPVGSTAPPALPGELPAAEEAAAEGVDELGLLDAAAAQVKSLRDKAEGNTDLAEEQKAEVIKTLEKAADWIKLAKESEQKRLQYVADAEAAPRTLVELKQTLAEPHPDPVVQPADDATLGTLEGKLTAAQAEFKAAETALAQASEKIKNRAQRKAEMGQQHEQLTARLKEVVEQLKAPPATSIPPALANARRAEMESRRKATEIQLATLAAETIYTDSVSELLPLRRDMSQRQLAWHEKNVAAWQEVVANFRKAESARQAREARRRVSQAHPALKAVAQRNANLAERRTTLAAEIDRTSKELEKINGQLQQLKSAFDAIKEKAEVAGFSVTVGHLLRKQRDDLPKMHVHYDRINKIETTMPRVQLEQMELEEERSAMGDLDAQAEQMLDALGGQVTGIEPDELEAMVREFLQNKREYVDNLLGDTDAYYEILGEVEIATRKLITQTEEFSNYVDKHVLWIRSTDPLGTSDLAGAWHAFDALTDFEPWKNVGRAVWTSIGNHKIGAAVLASVCGMLLLVGGWLRGRLLRAGEKLTKQDAMRLRPTLEATAITFVVATVWPLVLWAIGWGIAQDVEPGTLVAALAAACTASAAMLFAAELVRQVACRGGLAEEHFGWSPTLLGALRTNLYQLIVFGMPLFFLVVLSETFDDGRWSSSLGRLTFISGMLLLATVLFRATRPATGVLEDLSHRDAPPWFARTRVLWRPLFVAAPLLLSVLAVSGYYYSAQCLALRLQMTFWLLLGLLLASSLAIRLLAIAQHKFFEQRKAAEAQRAAAEQRASLDAMGNVEIESSEELPHDDIEFDHQQVSNQIQRLFRGAAVFAFLVGCWMVWAEVLPALQILDKVELWSSTVEVVETVTDPDGNISTTLVSKDVPTTLKHLLVSFGVIGITLVAGRNLPGLLRLTVLHRLPIDHGGRHAIAIICGYVVTLTGFVFAFRMIGLTWQSVQWLVAAMTVGLGFGLQEIFANLVSGLIILFERPIRIGDLVTVSGTTGNITRMQMRATTITDFDRRELIVPNKKFITDDVINWTLSDPISRVVIPVGIAYGSDTGLAHRTLLEVARQHPLVLTEPEPNAVFLGFGDSTLNFELRFFIATREHYVAVLHEMNTAIDDAFRAADLEIAFPQQDIHIRSITEMMPSAVAPTLADGGEKRAA